MANPLYPGYYPGKPVYRDRRPYLRPQPVELGGLDQVMSEIVDRVHNNLNIPKWLVDQEMKAIKSAFTLEAITPDSEKEKQKAAETKEIYGVEEMEEIEGATVSLELDFKKMLADPEQYLVDTLVLNPLKSITDIDETQGMARSEILKEMITDKKSPFYLGVEGITAEDVRAQEKSSLAPQTLDAKLHKKYATLGSKARDFSESSVSARSRNSAFNDFNDDLLSSLSLELTGKAGAIRQLGSDVAAEVNSARKLVSSRSAVVSSIRSLDSTLGSTKKGISKGTFFSPLAGAAKVSESDVRALKDKIAEVRTNIGSLSAEDRRSASNIEGYLGSLESGLDRYIDFSSGKIKDAKGLDLFLKTEGSRLFRGEFDQGIGGRLVSRFARDTTNNRTVQRALSLTNEDGTRIFNGASLNALRLARDLQVDWDYETLDDLLSDISDGRLPTQFIWKRVIQPRIERYTPSYWLKRGMKQFSEKTVLGRAIGENLYRYQELWNTLQKKVTNKIPFLGIVGNKNWELLKKKIANYLSELITKAIDLGTEGIGLIFDRIIKVAVRFVVEKTMDLAMKVWKAAIKLDFEEIEELIGGGIKALIPFIAGCITPFAFLAVVVFFIITIFTGVLPEEDATKEPGPLGVLIDRLLPWFGGYSSEDCPIDDALALPFENETANAPAFDAYGLVTGLKRGFWCYWNHQPDYDDAADRADLFDEIQFQYNSFPAALNECADCLFWCTWLPYIAYQNAGEEFDPTISYLGAQRMNDWFKSQAASGKFTYIDPGDPTACEQILDGDIVFWNVNAGTGWHVSMVYNVDSGTINTIHSNAPYKWLPLMCDGEGVQNPPGGTMTVVGFGRPSR